MQMNSAEKDGCSEVIMHRDNILTEGGASNIFLVLDDVIKTPSLDQNILPGITRDLVIHTIAELDLRNSKNQLLLALHTNLYYRLTLFHILYRHLAGFP